MSLASPYQEQYYVADGVTTSFAFGQGFTALNEIDIKCIIYFEDGTDCVPVFNVNTVTGYINIVTLTKPDGTVLTVPPAGSIVRIFRYTPEAQNVTASQLQNYTAKQLERVFDSIVAMIQEISYSDQHKTIRLTETQRDIAIDYLPNDKDQAVIYWDMESRKLMPAGFGQNQVVKSDGIEWLVYDNSEGKIYYVPREGGNPIPVGKATIHNDLSGRNAPDCHPESAITGLTQDLQELRDKDLALDEDVQTALNRSQEAKDTADEAKETAEYAQSQVAEAKEMAIDAKETAEGVEGIAQEAKDIADEALDKVTQEITDREDADSALQDQITINKGTMDTHIANISNPHSVTKTQVGLGNVDNTSDLDKPISTATQAALDLKMPISTKYGASISLTIDSSTYVVTAQLKDQDGNNLGTAQTIDLPLESVVVSGAYDSATKEVILTLQDGSTIRFSVADLVSGLQSEITAQNPLDADLVNDSTSAHKFVTATEKTNWNNHIASTNNPHSVTKAQVGLGNVDNTADLDKPISTATQTALNGKQATISDLATIRSNAQAGKAASDTIATYGNIVTHNVSEFATATQGTKADTAVQPADLATVATSGSYKDLSNKPTIPTVNNSTITITQGGVTKGSFTLNQATGDTINLDAGGGSGSGYHPDLFDVKWADHILNDVQWLRADTFSWQSGAVYQVAYQHLEDDIDGKTLQSETIAGTTIQFYLADDGHKICPASEESNVSAIYNSTGVAWYYIIDTANTRFKLPRTQFAFTGIRNGVGEFVEAGLPNIKGSFSATSSSTSCSGAFSLSSTSSARPWDGSAALQRVYNFNANSSSSVYKDSITTVQPKATEMYLYFYVGNFTQTALENTAGITTEEMNNKVNIGHEVIEFQEPTAANNYTWYRKYADGWVEQGGITATTSGNPASVTYPVVMSDSNYTLNVSAQTPQSTSASTIHGCHYVNKEITRCTIVCLAGNSGNWIAGNISWQVSGMAA